MHEAGVKVFESKVNFLQYDMYCCSFLLWQLMKRRLESEI